mmetsp:Transcript_25338/g.83270  ORF Transcript_25338/g.83270 Transcript_25338/m.83270 type:complete len:214 (+) Transcript_25338:600-1241(+)
MPPRGRADGCARLPRLLPNRSPARVARDGCQHVPARHGRYRSRRVRSAPDPHQSPQPRRPPTGRERVPQPHANRGVSRAPPARPRGAQWARARRAGDAASQRAELHASEPRCALRASAAAPHVCERVARCGGGAVQLADQQHHPHHRVAVPAPDSAHRHASVEGDVGGPAPGGDGHRCRAPWGTRSFHRYPERAGPPAVVSHYRAQAPRSVWR